MVIGDNFTTDRTVIKPVVNEIAVLYNEQDLKYRTNQIEMFRVLHFHLNLAEVQDFIDQTKVKQIIESYEHVA